jgi:hypothetical protein
MSEEKMQTGGVYTGESSEHRRHDRLRVDTKIKYKVINRAAAEEVAGPGVKVEGQTLNISLSGLAIATETLLKKGDYLKVELSLPGMQRPTRALAEVMWVEEKGGQCASGIRFLILLNEADDSSIKRFMSNQGEAGGV